MKTINLTCLKCGTETTGTACSVGRCEVCGAGDLFDMKRVNRITRRYTATDSFAELCEMCQPTGADRQTYSPSIYVREVNGRRNKPKELLAAALRAAGYRVFDGSRVN